MISSSPSFLILLYHPCLSTPILLPVISRSYLCPFCPSSHLYLSIYLSIYLSSSLDSFPVGFEPSSSGSLNQHLNTASYLDKCTMGSVLLLTCSSGRYSAKKNFQVKTLMRFIPSTSRSWRQHLNTVSYPH